MKSANQVKAKMNNKHTLDDPQFPILCQTCLGDNPYMRMMVDRHGQECKVCNRPFVTYRWCPGAKMRYKKTEICRICAKAKNVCQTCLLDLKYNLPVQARDNLLQVTNDIPRSDVNREYYSQILEKKLNDEEAQIDAKLAIEAGPSSSSVTQGKELVAKDTIGKELSSGMKTLSRLARKGPYHKRNLPHICSFWVKGECKRGDECPYRHEKPSDPDDPLSKQNIKDRYYGTKDPVAQKILARAAKEEQEKAVSTKREPTEFFE